MADSETKEVGVGTVTCLNNFDLMAIVPVIVVEKGAAAVQASGDFNGIRRPVIFDGFMNGDSPEEIFAILDDITGHSSRQYGIVDTLGRSLTFTGPATNQWAGGVTGTIGTIGTIEYAIQGNILAGACVVESIEAAIRDTEGDMAERIMAGMRAARDAGGDGRCSCSPNNPTGCGCPVDGKSGHIGGVFVARPGDTDDSVCNSSGCADGDYFMRLNTAFQGNEQPDPVDQLQEQFDDFRAALDGRPDAARSTASFDPPLIPANGVATTTISIALRDWRGEPLEAGVESLTVEHAAGSAGLSGIGAVRDNGDGTYDVTLTAGVAAGVDRFDVVADDGVRPVELMPRPTFKYFERGDLDGSGAVDFDDLLDLLAQWGQCPKPPALCPGDLDGNGSVGFGDLLILLSNWTP
jgi:hypothetical protein